MARCGIEQRQGEVHALVPDGDQLRQRGQGQRPAVLRGAGCDTELRHRDLGLGPAQAAVDGHGTAVDLGVLGGEGQQVQRQQQTVVCLGPGEPNREGPGSRRVAAPHRTTDPPSVGQGQVHLLPVVRLQRDAEATGLLHVELDLSGQLGDQVLADDPRRERTAGPEHLDHGILRLAPDGASQQLVADLVALQSVEHHRKLVRHVVGPVRQPQAKAFGQEHPDRPGQERAHVGQLHHRARRGRGRQRPDQERCRDGHGGAAHHGTGAGQGDGTEAPRAVRCPGTETARPEVGLGEGLAGVGHPDLCRQLVPSGGARVRQAVHELVQHHGGGHRGVGPDVGGTVGDDQCVPGRQHGLQEQLTGLRTRVPVTQGGVTGQQVVPGGDTAGQRVLVQPEDAHDTVGHGPQWRQGTEGDGARAERGAGRIPHQEVGQQAPKVRQGEQHARREPVRTTGGVHQFLQHAVQAAALPRLREGKGAQGVHGRSQRGAPGLQRPALEQARPHVGEGADGLRHPGRHRCGALTDGQRCDVADRQGVPAADRGAHEELVQARLPRVGTEVVRHVPGGAMVAVQPPAHVGVGDPVVHEAEVVHAQSESVTHGRQPDEVADRGCREPAGDQVQQRGQCAEQGDVGAGGPVGDAVPEAGRGVVRGPGHVLRRAEDRLDDRRELLDPGAEDGDVTLRQGPFPVPLRAGPQQVQDGVAQHLHLAGGTGAGVDLDAPVPWLQPVGGIRCAVRTDVLLQPGQERRPGGGSVGRLVGRLVGGLVEQRRLVRPGPPVRHRAGTGRGRVGEDEGGGSAGGPEQGRCLPAGRSPGPQEGMVHQGGEVMVPSQGAAATPDVPVGPTRHRTGERRRRREQQHGDVPMLAERIQQRGHVRRERAQPEQEHPLRQDHLRRSLAECVQHRREPLRRTGATDLGPHGTEQAGLPDLRRVQQRPRTVHVPVVQPGPDHVRSVHAVPVQQVGERRGPTRERAPDRTLGQRGQGVIEPGGIRTEHAQDRPGQPVHPPRVRPVALLVRPVRRVGLVPQVSLEHPPAELRREGEVDVGADAVRAQCRAAEPLREALGQPPPHADGGHGHPLTGQRVRPRNHELVDQEVQEGLDSVGDPDVQHGPGTLATLCDSGDGRQPGRATAGRADQSAGGFRCRVIQSAPKRTIPPASISSAVAPPTMPRRARPVARYPRRITAK